MQFLLELLDLGQMNIKCNSDCVPRDKRNMTTLTFSRSE